MTRRIGLLGGTFDPPHHGHLIIAAEAHERLGLNELRFVPAAVPPHKDDAVQATGEQRLRMLLAAVDGDRRFAVDDMEIRRGGTSYTVDTLRELRRREMDAELVFLLGIDQFRALHTWREPDEVANLATLTVLSRAGETPQPAGAYSAIHLEVSRIDVSSTEIRRRCAQGLSSRYYVPEAVRAIIEEERIYR